MWSTCSTYLSHTIPPHTPSPLPLLSCISHAWHGKERPVRDQQKGTGSKGKGKNKKTKEETHTFAFLPNQQRITHHPTIPPHPFCRIERRLPLSLSSCACVSVMRVVGAVLETDGKKKTLRKFRPGSRFLASRLGPQGKETRQLSFIASSASLSLLDDSVTSRLPPTLPPVLCFYFGSGGLDSGHKHLDTRPDRHCIAGNSIWARRL